MVYAEGYWKVRLVCLIMLVALIAMPLFISYMPRHIGQGFSGIELLMVGEDEYEVLQVLNISIDGQVRYGVFAAYPWFDGSIEVSGYDFTIDNPNLSIRFINGFSMGGSMMYPVLFRGATRIESLGMLYTNEDFSSLIIHVTEWTALGGGSYQGQQGNRVIAAPTTDSSDALELLRSHNFFWSEEFGVVRYHFLP